MSELTIPASADPPAVISAVPQPGWRGALPEPVSGFLAQPAVARALPAIGTLGLLAAAGAVWLSLASYPDRLLYSSLSDAERAKVVEALDKGGIGYAIDNQTGAVSVAENDLYRARMLVASDAGIAAPAGASEMLDSMPLGASRTLEGERLRLARERELVLTISEIDGIESVRVHLATPERSVFVRENSEPSASVMVRLTGGRSLSQSQVEAIINLVAASVPGMSADAVRVVDQNGRLLSSVRKAELDPLVLQREFEAKLREQIDTLLLPLLGNGNYSAQVQVALDQSEVTSARETYEKDGAIRNESERNTTRSDGVNAGGVPGVTANTPPPETALVDAAPQASPGASAAAGSATDTESAVQRSYELGREVAVTSTRPGRLTRLSVAVAVSDAALKKAAPLTAAQLEALVGAAVGADLDRGDQVAVVKGKFDDAAPTPAAFYEEPWFAMLVRYGTALLAVLLVLLLAVRPLIAVLRKKSAAPVQEAPELVADVSESEVQNLLPSQNMSPGVFGASGDLPRQVELARRLAASQPDRAVEALQRMLAAGEARGPSGT